MKKCWHINRKWNKERLLKNFHYDPSYPQASYYTEKRGQELRCLDCKQILKKSWRKEDCQKFQVDIIQTRSKLKNELLKHLSFFNKEAAIEDVIQFLNLTGHGTMIRRTLPENIMEALNDYYELSQ